MLIRCKALRAFTQFVPGHGQVHGDPDNQDERVSFPEVPESYVQFLVDEGKVEAPSATVADLVGAIAAAAQDALADGDIQSRVLSEDEVLVAGSMFSAKHVGGGKFQITGPGLNEPIEMKGKAAAEARAAELEAAMAKPIDAPTPEGDGEGEGETATEDAAPL